MTFKTILSYKVFVHQKGAKRHDAAPMSIKISLQLFPVSHTYHLDAYK